MKNTTLQQIKKDIECKPKGFLGRTGIILFEDALYGEKFAYISNEEYYYLSDEDKKSIDSITEDTEEYLKGYLYNFGYNI